MRRSNTLRGVGEVSLDSAICCSLSEQSKNQLPVHAARSRIEARACAQSLKQGVGQRSTVGFAGNARQIKRTGISPFHRLQQLLGKAEDNSSCEESRLLDGETLGMLGNHLLVKGCCAVKIISCFRQGAGRSLSEDQMTRRCLGIGNELHPARHRRSHTTRPSHLGSAGSWSCRNPSSHITGHKLGTSREAERTCRHQKAAGDDRTFSANTFLMTPCPI